MTKNNNWRDLPQHKNLAEIIDTELQYEPFTCETTQVSDVPIYIKHIPEAPCVHIRIGFRYGAMHDQIGKEGTAHFLEHMLFDGSSMFANEKETQEFGKVILLDSLNAHTSFLELFITGKCLPHNFNLAIQGIMSMIIEPKLTKEAFEHEQKVITQEAWGVFLNEKRLAYINKERDNRFFDLPNRIRVASALGWPDTIAKITLEDIRQAHKQYLVKENMEMYIAGNIDSIGGTMKLIEICSSYIQNIPNGKPSIPAEVPHHISAPKQSTFDHTYEEVGLSKREQAKINIAVLAPRINKKADAPDTAEETVYLASWYVAGELLAELVFRKLRLEHSWCYGAGASTSVHIDHISLDLGGTIDSAHIDESLEILKQLVDDIKNGAYQDDFEKTKRLIVENSIARERTTKSIIDRLMDHMRLHGRIITLREILMQIQGLSFTNIQSVLKTYSDDSQMFIEIIR